MRLLSIIVAAIFFTAACSRSDRLPSGVLSQNKIYPIIWDLTRADEYVNNHLIKENSTRDRMAESVLLYEEIFRIHNTTKEQFNKSLAFYQSRPDMLKTLMDTLKSFERRVLDKPAAPTERPPFFVDSAAKRKAIKPVTSN
jgi:hypothetical protein